MQLYVLFLVILICLISSIASSTSIQFKSSLISKLKGGSTSNKNNQMNIKSANANNHNKISLRQSLLGSWGVLQVVTILGNAIKRLIPIALQPFQRQDLLLHHWITLISWVLVMGYTEGYKAFHLKFSPLVVKRAFKIADNASFLNIVIAGPFSMGLFGATKKRMIISWSISVGVLVLVKLVKELPYPWRSIVVSGVVVGLGIGTLSILYHTFKVFFSKKLPEIDDQIPPRI